MSSAVTSFAEEADIVVLDVLPGEIASYPEGLVMVGEKLFFSASTPLGRELWVSDGTPQGTRMTRDINPGWASSYPDGAISAGDLILFAASDGVHGHELWRSDGTAEGTVLVRDINPGNEGSGPRHLTPFKDHFLFSAYDAEHGHELWRTDGTAEGTWLVADVRPGAQGSFPHAFTLVDDEIYFLAAGALWRTDGTADGTHFIVTLPYPGPIPPLGIEPDNFVAADGILYFSAWDPTYGKELWRSDGTASGTYIVADINPGDSGSSPRETNVVDDQLYFVVWIDQPYLPSPRMALWISDGTAEGTRELRSFWRPGKAFLTAVGSNVFFAMDNYHHGTELWKTDGTPEGTVLVKDINPTSDSYPSHLTEVQGLLFFAANDGDTGWELWRSDGTASGTVRVADIYQGNESSEPRDFVDGTDVLFFTANDGIHGREPMALLLEDRTPPRTRITSVPTDPSGPTVTFGFESWDAWGSVTTFCRLDDADFAPCTSPVTYTHLTHGPHTFAVKARDRAGNEERDPVTYPWTVDATPPMVAFMTADGSVSVNLFGQMVTPVEGIAQDDGAGVKSTMVRFTSATGDVLESSAALTCSEDLGACSWEVDPPAIPGAWMVQAWATDLVGNESEEAGPITLYVIAL